MTVLTANAVISVGNGTTVAESVSVTVAPAIAAGPNGNGRLIHPTLGTYDYDIAPFQWSNMLSDAIVSPIWSSQLTLDGATSALWQGNLKDTICQEIWTGELAMRAPQFAMLLAMYQSPPDPETAWVQWWPSYINNLGYNVIITGLSVGGSSGGSGNAMLFDGFVRGGYVSNDVTLTMRIVSRVP